MRERPLLAIEDMRILDVNVFAVCPRADRGFQKFAKAKFLMHEPCSKRSVETLPKMDAGALKMRWVFAILERRVNIRCAT